MSPLLVVLAAAVVSGLVTALHLRLARARLVDVPVARSSHGRPTPTGGGTGFMAGIIAAALLHFAGGGSGEWLPLIAAALLLALTGFLDDLRGLSVPVRLLVQCLAAGALVLLLLEPRGMHGWLGGCLLVLLLIWMVNLFNFMDGIDGLAATHAVFMFLAVALLAWRADAGADTVVQALGAAAAVAVFLCWNWPAASLFMGDTGSFGLGMLLAGVTLHTCVRGELSLAAWLILWAPLACDATLTLLHRAWRGEALFRAHREHAYQRLALRWGSHRRVTLGLLALDALWLLPLALLADTERQLAPWIALVALLPVAGGVALVLRARIGAARG